MMINETSANLSCRSCGKPLHTKILDMGSLPLCNRFLLNPVEPEYLHPLALGICPSCGLLQILEPPPVGEVAPRFPWIMYNEPEGHLDHLAGILLGMVKANGCTVVAGVSYKDDTTLERLRVGEMGGGWRITPEELGVNASKVEIETVQERFTPERAAQIGKQHGSADILIVRHILEHAHDLESFLAALKILVRPEGLLVFEVPDCTAVLTLKDYSTIWEEHILYFTPFTLQVCLESHGFEVLRLENYPYPLENSLVAIARPLRAGHISPLADQDRERELDQALDYLAAFPLERARYQQDLAEYRHQGGKIALLGAGHLACAFVNLLGLKEYIECILDDDPNRQGLFMPGSRLPIKPSTTLQDQQIRLCLLSLNPMNEERVIARQQGFVERGGEFKSIFPASQYAMRRS
jgi:hypothetical protein